MSDEYEPDEEPAVELEGQTSIDEVLIELGEKPVPRVVVREPTDEEITAFLDEQSGNG